MVRILSLAALSLLCSAASLYAADLNVANPAELSAKLASATPGASLVLGEGHFPAFKLPQGVSVKGAGAGKTIIDAGNADVAFSPTGDHVTLTNLSISTHGSAAVNIQNARNITVSNVIIHGGAIGIRISSSSDTRIENVVADQCLTGINAVQCDRLTVVNCTLTRNNSCSVGLTNVTHSTIFNNIINDSGTGIMINGGHDGLHVDHNSYLALYVGRIEGQITRVSMGLWRSASGQDVHSVQVPIKFADADAADYRQTALLNGFPETLTTDDWGVSEFDGSKAPDRDLFGNSNRTRHGVGLGAVASSRPAHDSSGLEGTLEISSDEGYKSAGIFTPEGKLVRYLFQAMPLKKGSYAVSIPTRDTFGQPTAAGQYEIRVAEGNTNVIYKGIVGNNGLDNDGVNADIDNVGASIFAADGSLLIGTGWSERGVNLFKRDIATRKGSWRFSGAAPVRGLALDDGGMILLLRQLDKNYELSKVDPANGKPLTWNNGLSFIDFPSKDVELAGLCELDGKLFLADKDGKLYITSSTDPKLENPVTIPEASLPVSDRVHKLVWLISAEKVIAVDAAGNAKAELNSVKSPVGVATNGKKLAVASYDAGKVFLFDINVPAEPKAIGSIGTGDGPYGPVVADRFWFQKKYPYNAKNQVPMDMDKDGRLTVTDFRGRVQVFDANLKSLYSSFAQFGNSPFQAYFDDNGDRVRFFDSSGTLTWWLDDKHNKWEPDAYWGCPPNRSAGCAFFSARGKKFGAYFAKFPTKDKKPGRSGIMIVRYDNYVGKPVGFYTNANKGWVVIRDINNDGVINDQDGEGTPLTDADGKLIEQTVVGRFQYGEPNGDLRNGTGALWKLKGLDKDGNPEFEFSNKPSLDIHPQVVASPYDFKKHANLTQQSLDADCPNGDELITIQGIESPPTGMCLSNSGGMDIARIRPDGSIGWYHPLQDYGPIQGASAIPGFVLTCWGHQCEWIGMDDDGLILSTFGFPPNGNWDGYWLDHPNHWRMYVGNDAKPHILAGDYSCSGQHWLDLVNTNNYVKHSFPLTIDAAKADKLAAAPAQTHQILSHPNQPRITIPKLATPMPIDGDMVKWRKAGITPQILVTPMTGSGGFSGPTDCSAVIRLAYEADNLYVQVLRFDDVVVLDHTVAMGTQNQDTVEMMINGFAEGYQFSVSHFGTDGDLIVRRRFFGSGPNPLMLKPENAGRVIKVLDSAKDVEERRLIESSYGIDLSHCKTIIYEYKIPIDKETWQGGENTLFPVASGKSFWLGFMIDDNDVPGTDIQRTLVWPANYGTFFDKTTGALATFE